jgi:predicted O-linked N-acetylglucosamine transferase (SPINDLY family)
MRQGDVAAAKMHCRAGLADTPSHVGLLIVLAATLRAGGAYPEAVEALVAATRAEPADAGAWLELGNACMEAEVAKVGLTRTGGGAPGAPRAAEAIDLAIDAFQHALALQPSAVVPRAHLAMAARYACDWVMLQSAEDALKESCAADAAHCAFSPMMAVALLDDAATQRDVIRAWSGATLPRAQAPAHLRQRGNRLRVGYLSSDFHDHATAHLMAGMFEQHDRARIETFAYASDGDDGSAMRRRLHAAFGNWRDIRLLDDRRAAELMSADALDVLVDLKGHTDGNRLAVLARRPAPVQLHYLGFPGTLGFEAIDGFIADDVVAPAGSQAEFAETLMRLPLCYQVNDQRRVLPPAAARSVLGLADDALVLACFGQTYKLSEPFLRIWLEALREHARAVLWLYVPHARARHHLRDFAERAGIDAGRVVFAPAVPQAEHLARLRCADLALDVLPYGSHTTGSDALWAGVPLLTCRGRTFAGRVGASLCHSAGLAELVTESLDDYSRVLRRLCSDRSLLAHHRNHLESGRERLPLFDTASFTREFERLLERAVSGDRG